jgi:hypothetical protein
VKRAAAKQVHVNVKDRLTSSGAGVHNRPIAAFIYPLFARKLGGNSEQVPELGFVLCSGRVKRMNVLSRSYQNVYRGLRIYVAKRNRSVILKDHCGCNLFR